jgi:hypothetical protein
LRFGRLLACRFSRRDFGQPRHPAIGRNNMRVTIDKAKNEMTVTITMQEAKASASGKTLVIASTHGNQATGVNVDGRPVIVGLNAYVRV